ncbi:Sua5/YciO/YrdC/YwlC family protein [Desulfurella amilsii]|uniref:Sua5/YciO/YrdC/YwlC family protein n=1 Tax=Desulfurella amilsii TaxID=1562698 RepID=UPI000A325576|nr:Sua5/YciO/YrdC/YwlC family protein [Desulfurella amilsii]
MKTIICRDKGSFNYLPYIKNGMIIYPADTIYGLGAYIYNAFANKRIFEIKKRSIQNPFIVLCDMDFVLKNVFVDETALNLLNLGATVILKNKTTLPFYVSKNGKTAYRLAVNPFMVKIVKKIPLTSTSVNVSAKQSINSTKKILQRYFGIVDIIIIGKTRNVASSIVDFENKVILREGYNAEAIKKFLGVV